MCGEIIRRTNKNALIVCGGYLTAAANTILRKTEIDVCVVGDGEIALQLQDKNGATLVIVYNVSDGKEVGRFNFNFSQ